MELAAELEQTLARQLLLIKTKVKLFVDLNENRIKEKVEKFCSGILSTFSSRSRLLVASDPKSKFSKDPFFPL